MSIFRDYLEGIKSLKKKDRLLNGLVCSSSGFAFAAVISAGLTASTIISFAGTTLFLFIIILIIALFRRL